MSNITRKFLHRLLPIPVLAPSVAALSRRSAGHSRPARHLLRRRRPLAPARLPGQGQVSAVDQLGNHNSTALVIFLMGLPYMTSALRTEVKKYPKFADKEYIAFGQRGRGEGVKKSENFADVIYGSNLN